MNTISPKPITFKDFNLYSPQNNNNKNAQYYDDYTTENCPNFITNNHCTVNGSVKYDHVKNRCVCKCKTYYYGLRCQSWSLFASSDDKDGEYDPEKIEKIFYIIILLLAGLVTILMVGIGIRLYVKSKKVSSSSNGSDKLVRTSVVKNSISEPALVKKLSDNELLPTHGNIAPIVIRSARESTTSMSASNIKINVIKRSDSFCVNSPRDSIALMGNVPKSPIMSPIVRPKNYKDQSIFCVSQTSMLN